MVSLLSVIYEERISIPRGSLVFWTHAITPMIGCDKITSWVPHNRYSELFQRFNDVFTVAILIRKGIARVINAAVYAAAHVSEVFISTCTSYAGEINYSVNPP